MDETAVEYLWQMRRDVKDELCKSLEHGDSWKILVLSLKSVEIRLVSIKTLRKEIPPSTPARKLVEILETNGFLILDTFKILAYANLQNAMWCLEDYVNPDLKNHIEEGRKRLHKPTYFHELPEDLRRELCYSLDACDGWECLLAALQKAGFVFAHIQRIKRLCPSSPADEFIKQVADRNIKISTVYVALASRELYRSMDYLKSFVSEEIVKSVDLLLGRDDNAANLTNEFDTTGGPISSPIKQNIPEVLTNLNCIPYTLLDEATKEWSQIIKGNFYRGTIDGKHFAIKRLKLKNMDNQPKVLEELRKLDLVYHVNVLKMAGFIEGHSFPCLIYPYYPKRSVYDVLSGSPEFSEDPSSSLSWEKKKKIGRGVANALVHLHKLFDQAVAFKSSDILLDENYEPKVADPCLPCVLEFKDKKMSYYLPQLDCLLNDSKLNHEEKNRMLEMVDCFCFRTILLELLLGIPADAFPKHPSEWISKKKTVSSSKLRKIWKESKESERRPLNEAALNQWIIAIIACSDQRKIKSSSATSIEALNYAFENDLRLYV